MKCQSSCQDASCRGSCEFCRRELVPVTMTPGNLHWLQRISLPQASVVTSTWPHLQQLQMALSILYHFSLSLGKKNIPCDSEACDWSAEGCMYGRTRVWAQAQHAYFLTVLAACFSASSGHSGNFFLIYFSICVTTFGFNKSFPWVIFCCLHGFYLRQLVEEDKTRGLPVLDTEHKQLKVAAGWLAELEDPDHLVSRSNGRLGGSRDNERLRNFVNKAESSRKIKQKNWDHKRIQRSPGRGGL